MESQEELSITTSVRCQRDQELSTESFTKEETEHLSLRTYLRHDPSQRNVLQWFRNHETYQEGKNRWDYMFYWFLELERRDGDCVEYTKTFDQEEDQDVADWVHLQREAYQKGNLAIGRIVQLEAIGFEWGYDELEFDLSKETTRKFVSDGIYLPLRKRGRKRKRKAVEISNGVHENRKKRNQVIEIISVDDDYYKDVFGYEPNRKYVKPVQVSKARKPSIEPHSFVGQGPFISSQNSEKATSPTKFSIKRFQHRRHHLQNVRRKSVSNTLPVLPPAPPTVPPPSTPTATVVSRNDSDGSAPNKEHDEATRRGTIGNSTLVEHTKAEIWDGSKTNTDRLNNHHEMKKPTITKEKLTSVEIAKKTNELFASIVNFQSTTGLGKIPDQIQHIPNVTPSPPNLIPQSSLIEINDGTVEAMVNKTKQDRNLSGTQDTVYKKDHHLREVSFREKDVCVEEKIIDDSNKGNEKTNGREGSNNLSTSHPHQIQLEDDIEVDHEERHHSSEGEKERSEFINIQSPEVLLSKSSLETHQNNNIGEEGNSNNKENLNGERNISCINDNAIETKINGTPVTAEEELGALIATDPIQEANLICESNEKGPSRQTLETQTLYSSSKLHLNLGEISSENGCALRQDENDITDNPGLQAMEVQNTHSPCNATHKRLEGHSCTSSKVLEIESSVNEALIVFNRRKKSDDGSRRIVSKEGMAVPSELNRLDCGMSEALDNLVIPTVVTNFQCGEDSTFIKKVSDPNGNQNSLEVQADIKGTTDTDDKSKSNEVEHSIGYHSQLKKVEGSKNCVEKVSMILDGSTDPPATLASTKSAQNSIKKALDLTRSGSPLLVEYNADNAEVKTGNEGTIVRIDSQNSVEEQSELNLVVNGGTSTLEVAVVMTTETPFESVDHPTAMPVQTTAQDSVEKDISSVEGDQSPLQVQDLDAEVLSGAEKTIPTTGVQNLGKERNEGENWTEGKKGCVEKENLADGDQSCVEKESSITETVRHLTISGGMKNTQDVTKEVNRHQSPLAVLGENNEAAGSAEIDKSTCEREPRQNSLEVQGAGEPGTRLEDDCNHKPTDTGEQLETENILKESQKVEKACVSTFNRSYNMTLQSEFTEGPTEDQTILNSEEVNTTYDQERTREAIDASTTALTYGKEGNISVRNESSQHKEGETISIVSINDGHRHQETQNLILIHGKEKLNVVNNIVFGDVGMVHHHEPGEENDVLSRDIMAEDTPEAVEKLKDLQICESNENLWISETGEGEKKDRKETFIAEDRPKTMWNATFQLPSEDIDDPNRFSTLDDEDEDSIRVESVYDDDEDEPRSFLDQNETEIDLTTQTEMADEDECRKVMRRTKRARSKSFKKRYMEENSGDDLVENETYNYYKPVTKPTRRKRAINHDEEEYDHDMSPDENEEIPPRKRQRNRRNATKKAKYSGFGEVEEFNETIQPRRYVRGKKSSRKNSVSSEEHADSSEYETDESNSEKVSHYSRKKSSATRKKKSSRKINEEPDDFKENVKHFPLKFLGTRIAKEFADKEIYYGNVISYNGKFWRVSYDDGDSEEFDKYDLELSILVYKKFHEGDTGKSTVLTTTRGKKKTKKKTIKPRATKPRTTKPRATKPKPTTPKPKTKRKPKTSTKPSQHIEDSDYIQVDMPIRYEDVVEEGQHPKNYRPHDDPESYEGVRIAKVFNDGVFFGQVTDYNKSRKLWLITYDDGDMEEYGSTDLKKGLMRYLFEFREQDYAS